MTSYVYGMPSGAVEVRSSVMSGATSANRMSVPTVSAATVR